MQYDVIIIGAGITGAAIAMELSKYRLRTLWLEKHNDVAIETSRANSGIIHSGYDPKPGTLMARLNVLGAAMYKELAPGLNIHYRITGSLVIGRTEADLAVLQELYERGVQNGVSGLQLLEGAEIFALEPNLNKDIRYALYSPTAAVISPWEACLAFAQTAVYNGVELLLEHAVDAIEPVSGGYRVTAGGKSFEAACIFNCAGVYADSIFDLLQPSAEERFTVVPVKGQYYLLDKSQGDLIRSVIFQTPNELGKGVLVGQTVHGNLIVGPDAQTVADKSDTSVGTANLAYIRRAAGITTDQIRYRDNIRNFAGLRAKLKGESDFHIGESAAFPRFFNFAGIQSPGLSCGPAFGPEAVGLLKASGVELTEKESFTYLPLSKCIREMTPEQIHERIQDNPLYGRIICRCESVTEGEIVDAIHQTVGAITLDGVKRRTNAGMGRCQGGFCGPKVLEILKRELGLDATEILQDQPGSYLVSEVKGRECHD